MTPQPKPLHDNSADATLHMIGDLAVNQRLNGKAAALKDAEAFARGCFAHIQGAEGPAYLVRFLQAEIQAGIHRAARDAEITRGRP